MGNTQYHQHLEVNNANLEEFEKKILLLSGIPLFAFEVTNVPAGEEGNYIRTIQVGDVSIRLVTFQRSKQKLVLIHGYEWSAPLFYKIMMPLAEKFHLIMIDIIGFGGSSRPNFSHVDDPIKADNFFVNYLESWRQSMGNLTSFVLAGHSFGAYIAGTYACRHHQHISKLLLLSPLGLNVMPTGFDFADIKCDEDDKKIPDICVRFLNKAYYHRWSPFKLLRKANRHIAYGLLGEYVKKRMMAEPDEERQAIQNYLYQIYLREESAEQALLVIFKFIYPINSLSAKDKLLSPDFPIPISIFYGDECCLERKEGQAVIEGNRFAWTQSNLYIIEKAGHEMFMHNPTDTAAMIIRDLEGLQVGPVQQDWGMVVVGPHFEQDELYKIREWDFYDQPRFEENFAEIGPQPQQ